MAKTFLLKPEHITLLTNSYTSWNHRNTGASSIDSKRPYGDSFILRDLAELILDYKEDSDDERDFEEIITEEQQDYLWKLHEETETALQIVLRLKTFEPGLYQTENYGGTWVKVEQ